MNILKDLYYELEDLWRALITKEPVNIGDKFIYIANRTDNPFDKINPSDYVTITGVQNGYVEWKLAYGTKGTAEIFIFRSMYKKKTI